jgi:hypothetical protein
MLTIPTPYEVPKLVRCGKKSPRKLQEKFLSATHSRRRRRRDEEDEAKRKNPM